MSTRVLKSRDRGAKSPPESRPSTFRQVFGAPGGDDGPYWRITGSGVSGTPEEAKRTREVVRFLESIGVPVERTSMMGMTAADSYYMDARFLDGGFSAETGNYIGGSRGAYINGAKAVLLVALGLRLKIPSEFFERHGLASTVTLDDLVRELKGAPGQ